MTDPRRALAPSDVVACNKIVYEGRRPAYRCGQPAVAVQGAANDPRCNEHVLMVKCLECHVDLMCPHKMDCSRRSLL